jgi:DNA-directed RNA polymerase I, II, and III subunit RPABC2
MDEDYEVSDAESEIEDNDIDDEPTVNNPAKKIITKTNDAASTSGDEDSDNDDNDSIDIESDIDEDAEYEEGFAAKCAIEHPLTNAFDEFSEDESDDDDENYLQKFDKSMNEQIIADFHPELKSQNYDEIENISRVVRDENGVIIDPLHKTLPFITRYERARILGERAKQINAGGKPFVEVDPTVIDGYLIALKEYEEKKIPFIIKRPLPNGGCEFWRFADLEILA